MLKDVSSGDSKVSLSGFLEAKVMDNEDIDKEGKIKVFIPKLMYDYEYDEKPYSEKDNKNRKKVSTELVLNTTKIADYPLEYTDSNYLIVRPTTLFEPNDSNWKTNKNYNSSGSIKVPRIGSTIFVFFLDEDPQKGYYLPLSPTKEGQKISTVNAIDSDDIVNSDVIRMYYNGMRIEANPNKNEIRLTTANKNIVSINSDSILMKMNSGNYINLNDSNITIKGDVILKDTLTVDKNTHLKENLDVDNNGYFKGSLYSYGGDGCISQGPIRTTSYITAGSYIRSDSDVIGNEVIANGIRLSTHIHSSKEGDTGKPKN